MNTRFLIVGGGITGLSFAQKVGSDDYLICEALDDVGGYCQTVKQDGFVWDYSGHFFHFRHPEIEEELVSRIGRQRVRKVARCSKIMFKGALVDFPFQRNIHQLPHAEFIECLVDLVSKEEQEPTNFKEMLYARFGKGITDKFLVPYNEKLYATDLARLDVNAMGRFFPHANTTEIIKGFRQDNSGSYNSTFTYPEDGAIAYVRAIQRDIPDSKILLNEPVLEIDLTARVARTRSHEIRYESLVSCIPFPKLLQLTGMPHDAATYSYNKVLVFNLGFDKKGPSDLHWVYFPERDLCFYRVGFYDNICQGERMSLYVEIGYRADARLDPATIEQKRAEVLRDLGRSGIVTDQKLVSHHHVVLDPAYVHITESSNADVLAQKQALATRGVYSIGRYGSWTYCSIEDNIVEARELAACFNRTAQDRLQRAHRAR